MATEGEVLDLIYALVCIEKPEVCVETGTYHGHGTRAIMEGLESNGKGHLWTVEETKAFNHAVVLVKNEAHLIAHSQGLKWPSTVGGATT